MDLFEIYSKRQKRLRGEYNDIFFYDILPESFRIQVIHIIKDAFGQDLYEYNSRHSSESYQYIHNQLCREYGKFKLIDSARYDDKEQVIQFLQISDVERGLDVIELTFRFIEQKIKPKFEQYLTGSSVKLRPEAAIEELNRRFKENALGYSFVNGEIIRVDSSFTHSEVILPAINLINNTKFQGANLEFMSALEHYRHGRNKEALSECLKAFESTMKIICKEKGWVYNSTDTSKKLIQICFQNTLVPSYTQNQFTSLQSLLESGIPTIRNKVGAHGQGPILQEVDDQMTRYALNLTGSNIIFLIEQSKL